jgi:cytochrome c-type biogenesis protein CcmH
VRPRALAALAAAALTLAATSPAVAAAACPKTTLGAVEHEVMCPVCGVPLALATEAPQAIRERAFITRLIAQCRSKDEIKRALASQFGDRVLALPGDRASHEPGGVVFGARVLPWLVLGAVAVAVAAATLRWRRRERPAAATSDVGPADDPRELGRLQSDLDRYDP